MSNFAFLKAEWPDLHEAAAQAEALAFQDARAACFYARRTLELAVHWLRIEPAFKRLSEQVKAIAGLLEEKSSIPMVHEQMRLIQDIQTDEWWQDVTVPILETVRRRLRALVKLIEKQQGKPNYTDFEDELGSESPVELPPHFSTAAYIKLAGEPAPGLLNAGSCLNCFPPLSPF